MGEGNVMQESTLFVDCVLIVGEIICLIEPRNFAEILCVYESHIPVVFVLFASDDFAQ